MYLLMIQITKLVILKKNQKEYWHDDFNTDKVCNSANPNWVGFEHMYEHCYLVTHDVIYVTFES